MRAFSLALAALCLAAPAAAQDGSEGVEKRTVESAQAFLGGLLSSPQGFLQYETARTYSNSIENYAYWQVASVETVSHCVTRVRFVPGTVSVRTNAPPNPAVKAAVIPYKDIDWSRVMNVEPSGLLGYPEGKANGFLIWLDVNSREFFVLGFGQSLETIGRAKFAASFLQTQCAPHSDTGF